MANAVGAERPSLKVRVPQRFSRFFDDHPTTVKAYVPMIVTISLIMQIVEGCC